MYKSGSSFKRQAYLLAFIWLIVLTTSACTTKPESGLSDSDVSPATADTLLNSERIHQMFGSYGVEVLYSDSTTRVTSLYSLEGDINVTRTFAVVMYPSTVDSALLDEHRTIINGGSIGQVFKDGGWTVHKRSIYMGEVAVTDGISEIYDMMGGIDPSVLALYMYQFSVEKEDEIYDYATIAEIYHPSYLAYGDLRQIYTEVDDVLVNAQDVEPKLEAVHRFLSRNLMPIELLGQ